MPDHESNVSLQTKRFEAKREKILSAAALLFDERGVKGATFADIAGRVGLVPNSVTYYYRKKEDLAAACYLRATAVFERTAVDAGREATIEARVRGFLDRQAGLLEQIERGERPPLISFNELHGLPEPLLGQVYGAYRELFRSVRRLLRGPQTAALTRDELTTRAHLLLSSAHWLRMWIGRNEPAQYARAAGRLAGVLLGGVGGAARPWTAVGSEIDWRLGGEEDGGTGEAFLRAATRLLNDQGYLGASIAKIAAMLDLTKGAFYHRHDHKDDLIQACFERTFGVVRRALDLAESAGGRGHDRLRTVVCALVRFQLTPDGPLLRAAATSAMPDADHRRHVHRVLEQLTERVVSMIVDGLLDRSIGPLDAQVAAQHVITGVNATAEAGRWIPGVAAERAVQLYAQPLMRGLISPAC